MTSSVEPRLRGGFLSANSSVQHIASGVATYLGGLIISEGADNKLENFGTVGLDRGNHHTCDIMGGGPRARGCYQFSVCRKDQPGSRGRGHCRRGRAASRHR